MDSLRVTLVEDNAIFCFLFRKFLEEYSSRKIDIELFANGKLAWDHFESTKHDFSLFPNILFIDINMPLMNGWQLVEHLSEYHPDFIKNVTIYMISSSKSSFDMRKLEEFEFIKDYVIKPIDREGIYKILNEYIDNN